ncbi:sensor histidine kinase [Motilibacter deserti]|uniref:histidine kinase n=1 Tax=Motilibacter deserti TaxID=2714956 RepID=A0ABX0GRJ6_9ACTN|nr:histidine kinase [Motilibacter deserti]NHC13105.1 two-component sensor histidine kinase [Motilibacter deserti]
MRLLATVKAWLRVHPLAADALLALQVLVLAYLVPDDKPGHIAPPDAGTQAFVILGCAALVLRRRYPFPVWAATVVCGGLGVWHAGSPTTANLPTVVALGSLVVRTPRRRAFELASVTAAVSIAALLLADLDNWEQGETYGAVTWSALATAVGLAVQSHRAVLAAAEERALRAEQSREQEAQRRVAEERLRIARELHDVVAHHVSVVNVQSGVALHLLDTDPAQAREAVGHVRGASRQVLEEMGALLGVLRTNEDGAPVTPAPGFERVGELVESMGRAGLRVHWEVVGQPVALPALLDLTAYRLAQESLTNAAKHGTGSAEFEISYLPEVLVLMVSNPVWGRGASGDGTGHGLVGMRERVEAVGGTLDAGVQGGHFVVRAELPLAPRAVTGTAGAPR